MRRRPLSQRRAKEIAASARLVKDADHRDNHRWHLVAEDGTVLGHMEPSYGGASASGRNGWWGRLDGVTSSDHYRTRDQAATSLGRWWIRYVTAPERRTVTEN